MNHLIFLLVTCHLSFNLSPFKPLPHFRRLPWTKSGHVRAVCRVRAVRHVGWVPKNQPPCNKSHPALLTWVLQGLLLHGTPRSSKCWLQGLLLNGISSLYTLIRGPNNGFDSPCLCDSFRIILWRFCEDFVKILWRFSTIVNVLFDPLLPGLAIAQRSILMGWKVHILYDLNLFGIRCQCWYKNSLFPVVIIKFEVTLIIKYNSVQIDFISTI